MIAIVGAGPAGCFAGYCLAKKGKDVTIIEEHEKIGAPVHCTGIVTSSISRIIRPKKEFVVNRIRKAVIFSGKSRLEVRLKSPNLVLDREKFDLHIAGMAEACGAKILAGTKYIGNEGKRVYTAKGVFSAESIIGADGPLSSVAKINCMFGKRLFWHGVQARVKIENGNNVEFYPDIGTIAWAVPENEEIMRVGLMAPPEKANILFKKFLSQKFANAKIMGYQSGLIPVYNPRLQSQKGNVFLVGDAAAQVKATSGGGIIQGLEAAECLAECLAEGKDYEKAWKKAIGKELWLHLMMRKVMDRFSSSDWNSLVRIFSREKSRKMLENFDRDYPSRFALRMLLSEPRLAFFAKCLLRKPSKQKSF